MIKVDVDSPAAVLDVVGDACVQARVAENLKLIMASRWADFHPSESIDPHQLRLAGGNRPIRPGGDGTPEVAAFCVPEFGAKLGKSSGSAERYLADALDLQYRLPNLWARVCGYEIDAWQAQKIAQETRHLTLEQAQLVDEAIAAQVCRTAWSRLLRDLDAKIIEVDAENIARQAEARQSELGVWVGQSTDHGTKTIYLRVHAPDAIWFEAMIDRLAVVLARRGDQRSHQQRRAAAVGAMTNPLLAIRLLAQDAEPSLFDPDPIPEPVEGQPDEPPLRFPRIDHDLALARAAVAAIGTLDPAKLRPDATLYVHIAAETLSRGLGVTRVEDIGPIVTTLVAQWLNSCNVTVKPVIDLPVELTPVDTYEIPRAMRERAFLRRPTSVFPFSAGNSRRADLDHSEPYRPGVPHQTRESNLGPLTRREHNVVTHGDWRRRQPEPGTHLFRAPHGNLYLVNATGTHDLGNGIFASLIWHAATPVAVAA